MKIAIRSGHNELSRGCSALIDEVVEDRKVKDSIIKYLKQLGHSVLDVTPGNMDSDSDLVYGVSKANNWGADLFISIHFNKAYNSYNGAIGTEAWVYSKSDNFNDEVYAQRIVDNIAALGFKNRGVKESKVLYELKNTKMPAVIIEVCFVEATEDVALYKKVGSDKIGQVIAEGIVNKKVDSSTTSTPKWVKNNTGWWYDLGNGQYPANKWMLINNEYYYFNKDGYAIQSNWLSLGGKWYFFNSDCKMIKNQWLKANGKEYYFLANGEMATESVFVDGKWYTIKSNGEKA